MHALTWRMALANLFQPEVPDPAVTSQSCIYIKAGTNLVIRATICEYTVISGRLNLSTLNKFGR